MRGEEEREGETTPIREEHRSSSRREREGRAAGRERYIDGREDTTTDDEEEEEEERRPHGRLTLRHGRDLADVPRGQVLVEVVGTVEH